MREYRRDVLRSSPVSTLITQRYLPTTDLVTERGLRALRARAIAGHNPDISMEDFHFWWARPIWARHGSQPPCKCTATGSTYWSHSAPDLWRVSRCELLFPSPDIRQSIDDNLTRALSASRDRVNQGSVVPTFDRVAFAEQLAAFDFASPIKLEPVLAWTVAQMETGLVHINHPRYFGLFNPTPSFPAQCADHIAAVFNPQLATSTTSPAAVAIEAHVIQAMVQRFGLPEDATGISRPVGQKPTIPHCCWPLRGPPKYASDGGRAVMGRPTIYISRDSHLAWLKIAHQAGVGRDSVRLIATDDTGRMDFGALANALAADVWADHLPVMIVATAVPQTPV